MSKIAHAQEIHDDEWHVEGRLLEASNVVLRMSAAAPENVDDATPRAVYKPVDGERPLTDFPFGTLAHREVAASIVAHVGGWTCIPATHWYTGEFGDGSLQQWVGPLQPKQQDLVGLLEPTELESVTSWIPIAAFEAEEGPLVLAHADDSRLREIAALDVVLNNADRKGSHLIVDGDELYAIDNGLSFHPEEKLRTVLWGWAGEPLDESLTRKLHQLVKARKDLDAALESHLSAGEIKSLHMRIGHLLEAGIFPEPPAERYGLPWPPL